MQTLPALDYTQSEAINEQVIEDFYNALSYVSFWSDKQTILKLSASFTSELVYQCVERGMEEDEHLITLNHRKHAEMLALYEIAFD